MENHFKQIHPKDSKDIGKSHLQTERSFSKL